MNELVKGFAGLIASLEKFSAKHKTEAEQKETFSYLKGLHNGEEIAFGLSAKWIKDTLNDNGYNECADCKEWYEVDGEPALNLSGNPVCDTCVDYYIICEECVEVRHADDIADWSEHICHFCYKPTLDYGTERIAND
jgi:hypothetical protein